MFHDVTAVLFDLDGTLVNTIELILAAHEHAFRQHLRGPWPARAAIIMNFGRPLRDALCEYAAADGQPDPVALAPRMVATYRAFQHAHHDRLVKAYDGMRETLVALRERGYPLGVVTSKVEGIARVVIGQFDLAPLMDVSVFLENTERHKPEPDPLLEAARRGRFEARDALYVGDSIHDIAAGRAAGMKTAGALWGPFERSDLEAAGPDVLVERPRDLLALLPGVGQAPHTRQPRRSPGRLPNPR
ncbi:MAG: HAD-IA family hydrolase [Acidobacteria bacterium]|nr:HAD-IA family hydrolase [Acidobacteriota bacterium]